MVALQGKYFYPHFTDEKTKAQRAWIFSPNLHSKYWDKDLFILISLPNANPPKLRNNKKVWLNFRLEIFKLFFKKLQYS